MNAKIWRQKSFLTLFIFALAILLVVVPACASGNPGTVTVTVISSTTSTATTTVTGSTTSTTPPTSSTTTVTTTPPTSITSTTTVTGDVANGKQIFDYATSDSGQPIYGEGYMMYGEYVACANCHGLDGHGGTVYMMMFQIQAPNITWPVLSGPDPDMQHPPYTVDTLERAITQGIDPGGDQLSIYMPRWQMSASDLNDLIAYIMTLK